MEKFKKYLPSKRFSIILGSIFIAITLILIVRVLVNIRNSEKELKLQETQKEIALRTEFLDMDSDGDGLRDWEESLWGTDPKNSDSDGDGTPDGQEVKDYRDPTKPYPNDAFDPKDIAETKRVVDEYNALNESEKFSRLLFSNFIATQGINQSMSQEQIEYFVSDAVANIPEIETSNKYSEKNLTSIISEPTEDDLDKYWTFLGSLLVEEIMPSLRKDFEVFEQAINRNEPDRLSVLDKSIEKYKEAVSSMLEANVPNIYLKDHLVMTNSIEDIVISVTKIRNFFENPIISIPAINLIPVIFENIQKSLDNIGLLSN